jgi:3-mercaptopyruvate sulfurtransferase SseA
MRLTGYETVRFLQGGLNEWAAQGGFDAAATATPAPKH